MAGTFESLGGGIADLFGADQGKLKQHFFSDSIAGSIPGLTGRGNRIGNLDDTSLSNFQRAVNSAFDQSRGFAGEDVGALGGLINRGAAYDPLETVDRIRSGNFDALNGLFGQLEDRGASADKLSLAARGFGGRGGSSFENILRSDRTSRNLAPVANTIFQNLAPQINAASSDRENNIGQVLSLIANRAQRPYQNLDALLSPVEARQNALSGSINNLGALSDVAKTNTSGFQFIPNRWRSMLGNTGAGLDSAVGTLMSLYGSGALGGAGGGGGGSGSGGGGGL